MGKGKPAGGPKPNRKQARRERQARELRANLARRKEQSRARAAHRPEPCRPADEDGNDT